MKFVTDVKFDEERGKLRVAYHDIATVKATTSDDDEPISDNDTQQDVPNIVTSTAKPFGTAQYMNDCCLCHCRFIGHKRRVVCRVCVSKHTRE